MCRVALGLTSSSRERTSALMPLAETRKRERRTETARTKTREGGGGMARKKIKSRTCGQKRKPPAHSPRSSLQPPSLLSPPSRRVSSTTSSYARAGWCYRRSSLLLSADACLGLSFFFFSLLQFVLVFWSRMCACMRRCGGAGPFNSALSSSSCPCRRRRPSAVLVLVLVFFFVVVVVCVLFTSSQAQWRVAYVSAGEGRVSTASPLTALGSFCVLKEKRRKRSWPGV